ncbi:hypothetical protein GCM10010347_43460 [Streptomyces cirratus]|uniref:Uncharacterized protein n=1 Tax=Streptomyces cirratus TaxID=68187 RepID=A0ABQ3F0X2_9ACTN|nr:hypothetical protein GCM10010347_43460 [Streptomyces cirratus]
MCRVPARRRRRGDVPGIALEDVEGDEERGPGAASSHGAASSGGAALHPLGRQPARRRVPDDRFAMKDQGVRELGGRGDEVGDPRRMMPDPISTSHVRPTGT